MLQWITRKIVGSKNQRTVKKLTPLVEEIIGIEEGLSSLTDDELRAKTTAWQAQFAVFHDPPFLGGYKLEAATNDELGAALHVIQEQFNGLSEHFPDLPTDLSSGPSNQESLRAKMEEAREAFDEKRGDFPAIEARLLDEIMPEAFAVVKAASRRLCGQEHIVCDQPLEWNMVHFDVQLIGGICLHRGMIAEMATGEGKTLVATLPVYLNALVGRGVHLITVNDYLARRDSEWMGYLYKFLGLTVGCIQNSQPPELRREHYGCDVTYGTNSEFGFDYLRDNGMATDVSRQVQRGHYYAIIDEVDSVLIDEARTPLIISEPVRHKQEHHYERFKPLVDQLVKKQNLLCNGLVTEGNKQLEAGDIEEAGVSLFKCKLGNPRNRGLLRAMEEAETRKLIEKTEVSYHGREAKDAFFALKEELFYTIDERGNDADLTEQGRTFLNPDDPEAFVLPDLAGEFADLDGNETMDDVERARAKEALQQKMDHQAGRMHNITQLLKAYCVYEKDVQYVVEDNKVLIVDEGTGRKMPGRRWSDGLHQAVEAKEGVKIDNETQTFATITIQNYFRLYEKLSGMTGTAETDAAEFQDIYGLEVLNIPTNKPIIRIDQDDAVFKTRREKYNAVIDLIQERHTKGQPLLIGTASVESSETLGRLLKRAKIPHAVLNAKFHRQEAEIVSRAGQKGAVTVSTNMAGRGTDIKLGDGVAALGGLMVVGTERHESRRIDRQLRGRCARQGDPGESKFFLSFEDDLMRNFGAAERMTKMMERMGLEDGQELEHPWLNKSVETAQKRVEQRNYTWRKRVLDFDDVMNQQRGVVYGYRNEILESDSPRDILFECIDESVPEKVYEFLGDPDSSMERDHGGLIGWATMSFPIGLEAGDLNEEHGHPDEVSEALAAKIKEVYELKCEQEDPAALEGLERFIALNAVDQLWQEHLYSMDSLREGVSLRSYGQKDPLVEYKNDAFGLFQELMGNIRMHTLVSLFRATTNREKYEQFLQGMNLKRSGAGGPPPGSGPGQGGSGSVSLSSGAMMQGMGASPEAAAEADPKKPRITLPSKQAPKPKASANVGRNDPCPCGSGKKFKQCCGRTA